MSYMITLMTSISIIYALKSLAGLPKRQTSNPQK